MLTTDKFSCNVLADLLVAHGVKVVVTSPGSRNAPVIVALSCRRELKCLAVVDERQAAFNALGIASTTGEPVALVCTSGTALLNYAPAVAEAYYRAIPLIVISADRPLEWIDQDDSQTIWQDHALDAYVKGSWSLDSCDATAGLKWRANRCINDLLLQALSPRRGPVHLNLRLDAPLNGMAEYTSGQARVIRKLPLTTSLPIDTLKSLTSQLSSPLKVMIVAGFMPPNHKLNRALARMASLPNVAVLTETVANLHSPLFVPGIDVAMSQASINDLQPDVVITVGGALISRHIKEFIRALPTHVSHWAVGHSHATVDCFQHLEWRIDMEPEVFFSRLAGALLHTHAQERSDYGNRWREAYRAGEQRIRKISQAAQWCDLQAMDCLFSSLPREWNIQLSNGTPVRYAQLFSSRSFHRCDCNRGVSGIDGCLSTSIGASWAYPGITCLVTGDMSCQYDISALGSPLLTKRWKMIVLSNGGGGIFRFVSSTRSLPEREAFFGSGPMNLPLANLARAYGMAYTEACNLQEARQGLQWLAHEENSPAILCLVTPADYSAKMLSAAITPGPVH